MANGKAQIAIEDEMWGEFKGQIAEFVKVFGSLLFLPVILLVGLGYGLRAGFIAGAEKGLSLFRGWGE